MAAIGGSSPLATIGEDSSESGQGSASPPRGGQGSFSEHPDDHDLLEREGVRRDSSHMSSLEMPPQSSRPSKLGIGSASDYSAMRHLGYRSRQDTRMSVVSVPASVAS